MNYDEAHTDPSYCHYIVFIDRTYAVMSYLIAVFPFSIGGGVALPTSKS
jgi:hypothetical protein